MIIYLLKYFIFNVQQELFYGRSFFLAAHTPIIEFTRNRRSAPKGFHQGVEGANNKRLVSFNQREFEPLHEKTI